MPKGLASKATQPKVLFIGSGSEEVRDVLVESLETEKDILFRNNLIEALPDISGNGDVTLILTKPEYLFQAGKCLIPGNGTAKDSSVRLLIANGDSQELVGQSAKINQVYHRINLVASTDSTVLVEGESGTGKELVARAIHFLSHRSKKPFIKVNCPALPESLFESELFGHVRGAFTGAVQDRKGRFAQAQGGTILLDEIGSMPLANQAKLLRVLQENEYEPVGSERMMKADVRVIATNNYELAKAVEDGTFREDLYYRLSVFSIVVAPLRERIEDVPLLIDYFLHKHSHLNPKVKSISSKALKVMVDYHWPGNVRQLENAIQHALIVEEKDAVQPSSLPVHLDIPDNGTNRKVQSLRMRDKLKLYEKQLIQEALTDSNGVKKIAARLLGVHPKNFSHLLQKHDL